MPQKLGRSGGKPARNMARACLRLEAENKQLQAQLAIAVKWLNRVVSAGHENNCLFCALKDTRVAEALSDIEKVK